MCCKGLKKYGAISTKLEDLPWNADKYLSGQIFLVSLEKKGNFLLTKHVIETKQELAEPGNTQ